MKQRRFTLLDTIVLVAATAIGLAISRGYHRALGEAASSLPVSSSFSFTYRIMIVSPCVAAWTVALLAVRLRRPHVGIRRLARQPGVASCYSAAAMLAVAALAYVVRTATGAMRPTRYDPHPFIHLVAGLVYFIGPSIIGVWVAFALTGLWRREQDWIGHAGRCLGVFWIALYAACVLTS